MVTPLALFLGLLLAWLAARQAESLAAEPLRLPAGDPAVVVHTLPPPSPDPLLVYYEGLATISDHTRELATIQPPISDRRLRQIALHVRSRHDHITGVTAAEVTEMVVALARQRGIELRGKP